MQTMQLYDFKLIHVCILAYYQQDKDRHFRLEVNIRRNINYLVDT